MKKLLYLGIVLMFVSCGANESESGSSTVNVDGREVSTIKIDNLEVMTKDLERRYTWDDAMKACENLGDRWRLPTKDELNILYENKDKIGGFATDGYWSSTEFDNFSAWVQYFDNGYQSNPNNNFYSFYVRAVRAF